MTGSAPRMRGTRHEQRRLPRRLRFSPAHAGNTTPRTGGCGSPPVQPRACGEHGLAALGPIRGDGSAPRMRGTQRAAPEPPSPRRFSPAHAGNTSNAVIRWNDRPVQPRACGEHGGEGRGMIWETGSAPRMRGTLSEKEELVPEGRFSPAHAGNTSRSTTTMSGSSVQPRACGEHHGTGCQYLESRGSAPRMRGTHLVGGGEGLVGRFSPAHAGNTRARRSCLPDRSVQPRACGEHCSRCMITTMADGSAPRMRGTLR